MNRRHVALALVAGLAVCPVLWCLLSASSQPPAPPVRSARGAAAPAATAEAVDLSSLPADPSAQPALAAAAPQRSPQELAALAAPGAQPNVVSVEEGTRLAASYMSSADRPDEALALSRVMAADPEVAPLLAAEAERLRAASDPSLRARGVLIQSGLGLLDADGWAQALAAESDAAARAEIVAAPPRGGEPQQEARLTSALLSTARFDAAPEVRAAAIDALPALGSPADLQALVGVLRQDTDPAVRETVARHLRGAHPADPTVVQGLLASAADTNEQAEVRRASVLALMRIEEEAPGTLGVAGATQEQLARVLEQTTPDEG